MDAGTISALIGGYFAAVVAVFLIYSPVLLLFVGLLITAGLVQLLAWPFLILFRRLRRHHPEPPSDGSWLLR
ncbi:hypothetical protein [Arthrobacter sp. 754]|uniref:hypothetical protein n=1 Tax=Arthrobacter sp. 754 TaxID=3156315 RepID=UPI003392A4D0